MHKFVTEAVIRFTGCCHTHGLSLWRHITVRKLFMLAVAAFFAACANVVSPTGGPKDETPPVIIRSIPENYSPNFDGGQIRIFFDEFVTLSNIRQQLLVSPPLENHPDIRMKGRSIIIQIEEALRPNTTYNMFFGDAIRDITEGNVIENYQFVFSTGDYVDSLSLAGTVVDAFTLKPEEGVSVMLYDNPYDSVPYKERPVYFSRTGKEGNFYISNMRGGNYLLFALKDNNANYLYDLPDEMIAFHDSLVSPVFVAPPVIQDIARDSLSTDSLPAPYPGPDPSTPQRPDEGPAITLPNDTLTSTETSPSTVFDTTLHTDSTSTSTSTLTSSPQYTLHLFQQADTMQRITSSALVAHGHVRMTFRVPFDSICARDIVGTLPDNWYLPEFSQGRDTLSLWLRNVQADSLFLEIYDGMQLLDTIRLSAIPRETRDRRDAATVRTRVAERMAAEDTTAQASLRQPPVTVTQTARRGAQWPYYMPFSVRTSAPLASVDPEKIQVTLSDSINIEPAFSIQGPVQRILSMDMLFEEKSAYTISFFPGALTDMFGGVNDSIEIQLRTNAADDFGMIILNLGLPEVSALNEDAGPTGYILQLLDKDINILVEKHVSSAGVYHFPHLNAGDYGFRLIEDYNGNGKWDTGHYLRRIQPERVFMFPDLLQVRQNWETEESWNL